MTVETLAAFRAAAEGMNVQPVLVVTKDENGNLVVAKSDPATGGLVVTASISTADLATEVTLVALKAKIDSQLDVLLSSRAADATVQATNTKLDTLQTQMNAVNKGFFSKPYDELSANYAGATTDVWTSKLATVTQQTLTVTYADSTKAVITNVKVV